MKIFESGQAIERKHLVDEVDDMQLDGVVKTGTSKKVATNSNVRKPNSTLVLCALANYMVVSGMCPANIGRYESAVKSMENPIPGHILDIDGVKTFVAGEIPEVLAEKPILVSYLYEMPVKHNLHVNTMGKNYYGISLDEARIYKVTNDLFFVVDANAKQSLLEKCAISNDRSHLPSNSADIESEITDFYYNSDVKVEIVSARSSGNGSSSAGTKSSSSSGGVKSVAKIAPKSDNVLERVISKEKEQSGIKRIPTVSKMTLNSTEYASLDVSGLTKTMALINTVQLRSCDTDPGHGHFGFVFEHIPSGFLTRFLIVSSDPITGIMTLLTQEEMSEDAYSMLVPMILNSEPSGYKIHDLDKTKQKKPFFWNTANYTVFEELDS